ncbi:MAG TPA: ferritin-like domain-containing protein [Trebonia sp.]
MAASPPTSPRSATGINRAQVVGEFTAHAESERGRAMRAAERISQLGGAPDFDRPRSPGGRTPPSTQSGCGTGPSPAIPECALGPGTADPAPAARGQQEACRDQLLRQPANRPTDRATVSAVCCLLA